MIGIGKTAPHHLLSHQQGQVGRLGPDVLNRLAALMLDVAGSVRLDALGFREQALLVFLQQALGLILRPGQYRLGVARGRAQFGLVFLHLALRLSAMPLGLLQTVPDLALARLQALEDRRERKLVQDQKEGSKRDNFPENQRRKKCRVKLWHGFLGETVPCSVR